jgi:hypothetical protein
VGSLLTSEPEHTGGMIALIPANADELVVDGGDPAEQMHLTLAYLGDDVTVWPQESRDTLLAEIEELVTGSGEDSLRDPRGPIEARVMGHAQFNPDGGPDGDREPCAVYLVGDAPRISDLQRIIRGIVENKDGVPEQHDPMIPHITAGYGLAPDQLSFVGPLTFDRIRVALADDIHDFPLGETQEDPVPDTIAAAGGTAIVEATGPAVNGEIPIRLPVVVIEGLDTSDGRYLAAGSLQPRALPLPLLAQPESAHGGDDAGAAGVVGRIDTLERIAGPDVISKRTGQPFPEGTFVWVGTGAISETAKVGDYDIADLFRKRYLRGISVDLAGVDFEVLGDDGSPFDPDNPRRQVVTHSAELAAATLVPIPAFGDCYAEEATETETLDPIAPEDLPEGLAAAAAPAWRSGELGEMCGLCAAGMAEPVTDAWPAAVPGDAVDQLADVIANDGGQQRDAIELAGAIVDFIRQQWASGDDDTEVPDELDDAMLAAGPTPAAGPVPAVEESDLLDDDAPDSGAPQACEFGPEPAVRSLVIRDGETHVPVCDEHEQEGRAAIEAGGDTVSEVVEIDGAEDSGNTEAIDGEPSVTAAASPRPPAAWFADPQLDGPTALQVSADGRVFGHLATWGQCHVSFPNQCITAPRSSSGYAYFRVGAVLCDDASEAAVGHITLDTGHAGPELGRHAAAAHYDHTGTVVADVSAGEDAHGIWVAGALRHSVDEQTAAKLRAAALSGDWRRVGGGLELVAALAVNTPGFPVPRARVASGAPQSLVAAGVVPKRMATVDDLVAGAWRAAERVSAAIDGRPFDPSVLADQIAARLDERRRAGELSAQQEALLASLDETPQRAAALLAELDETPARFEAALSELEAGDVDPKAVTA